LLSKELDENVPIFTISLIAELSLYIFYCYSGPVSEQHINNKISTTVINIVI